MPTAADFLDDLDKLKSEKELEKLSKYFKGDDGTTVALGVKFGDIFKLAEKYWEMPSNEINKLLDDPHYEVRMGAVSIMDFQAKNKKTSPERKKELFDLYLRRHDRLNNWDFVDRGAYNIIGEYLLDEPKDILYELAKSDVPWKRRTAIVATYAFIKKGQVDETFKIAELLVNDDNEYINKAVGSWIREAGKKDVNKLLLFLDKYAGTMPRVTLRYAIEKLNLKQKEKYLSK
ncbi:DNA alkylation repair protein [Flavihumibacter sp. R14]|nr:DNA alkylation repair protein [Flavihumibacter soli]